MSGLNGPLSIALSALLVSQQQLETSANNVANAITLGVEAANGPLNDANRAAIVVELQGIQAQLVSLENTSFEGSPLFAGTKTSSPPFVLDNTAPSGVRYDGNNSTDNAQIGDGYQIAANKPGSQLFTAPGHDVFLALNRLIQVVQSNTGYDTAITSLRDSLDNISSQRVFYGNTLNQAQAQITNLGNTKVQLSQQENTLASADIESAASRLVNSQAATNATLAAIGKTSQLSLFDFLK